MRPPRRVEAIVIAAIVAAGACGGGRTAEPPRIGSVPVTARAGGGFDGSTAIAPAGGLSRALAAMPADYEVVVGLDATKVRASRLYARYEAKLRALMDDAVLELQQACGLDLVNTATGLLLGGKGAGLQDGTVFLSGLERATFTRCLDARAAQRRAAGEAARLVVDGDYLEHQTDSGPMHMLWLAPRSVMWIHHDDGTGGRAELRAASAARGGDGLTGSPAFVELLGRTRTDAAMWFVIGGTSSFVGAGGLVDARSIRGAFDAGDHVTGELRLAMRDAAAARTTAASGTQQLDQLRGTPYGDLVSDVTIAADGLDVVVSLRFSPAQLDRILEIVGQFGP